MNYIEIPLAIFGRSGIIIAPISIHLQKSKLKVMMKMVGDDRCYNTNLMYKG